MAEYVFQIPFFFALVVNGLMAQTQQTPAGAGPDEAKTPPIIIASQPDSPLVVSTIVRWATPGGEMLDLYLIVTNQDPRPVRAYATRIDLDRSNERMNQCPVENIYFPGKLIKQEQKDGKSRFVRPHTNMALLPIEVSVDFVEFADGSTWGQDTCKTAEWLAGERAGGEAAIKWLQSFIKEKGFEAAADVMRNRRVLLEKPDNPSAKWNEGFKFAINVVYDRVMMAYQSQGDAEVAVVLSKPYDASGVRPQ